MQSILILLNPLPSTPYTSSFAIPVPSQPAKIRIKEKEATLGQQFSLFAIPFNPFFFPQLLLFKFYLSSLPSQLPHETLSSQLVPINPLILQLQISYSLSLSNSLALARQLQLQLFRQVYSFISLCYTDFSLDMTHSEEFSLGGGDWLHFRNIRLRSWWQGLDII